MLDPSPTSRPTSPDTRSPRPARRTLAPACWLLTAVLGATVAAPLLAAPATARSGDDSLAELAEQVAAVLTGDSAADRQAERRAERRTQRRAEKGAEPGLRGAEPVKVGWWLLANDPPPEAETGVLAIPGPPTPTVPAGTLPVSAALGESDKVSAMEFRLAEPDKAVQSLVLGLQEAADPQGNLDAAGAVVLACQVTEAFWADGQAARWRSRPAYDCEQGAVEGVRDDTGRWTFDLTPLARTWTGEGAASPSVVLVEAVDAPGSFQVAFQGLASETIGLTAAFGESLLPPDEDAEADPEVVDAAGPGPSGSSSGGLSSGGSSGLGTSSGDLGSPSGSDPVPAADGAADDGGEVVAGDVAPAAALPSWYDGIPMGGLLLAPVALLVAFLAMLALGPDGQPVPGRPQRGVSLALERLRGTRLPGRS